MTGQWPLLICPARLSSVGGGGIAVRIFSQFSAISQFFAIFCNFSQFSAIFPQFFSLPDFLTDFSTCRARDCHHSSSRVQEGRLRHRNFSAISPQFFCNFSAVFPQFFAIGFDPPDRNPPPPCCHPGRRFFFGAVSWIFSRLVLTQRTVLLEWLITAVTKKPQMQPPRPVSGTRFPRISPNR